MPDQFILNEQTIRKMLEEAFAAGFDSPMDFLNQEIARIYNKHITKAKLTSCGPKPQKLKTSASSQGDSQSPFQEYQWQFYNNHRHNP